MTEIKNDSSGVNNFRVMDRRQNKRRRSTDLHNDGRAHLDITDPALCKSILEQLRDQLKDTRKEIGMRQAYGDKFVNVLKELEIEQISELAMSCAKNKFFRAHLNMPDFNNLIFSLQLREEEAKLMKYFALNGGTKTMVDSLSRGLVPVFKRESALLAAKRSAGRPSIPNEAECAAIRNRYAELVKTANANLANPYFEIKAYITLHQEWQSKYGLSSLYAAMKADL